METNSLQDKPESNGVEMEFKKPVFIGKLPKKVKAESVKVKELQNTSSSNLEESSSISEKTSSPHALSISKDSLTAIPYKEPKWSSLCPEGTGYALDVLKSGMIVETIDVTTKTHYVFGRMANCDVVMAHPTISRYHAVMQYKGFSGEGEPPIGWYLFDLGSTHGTFLNKEQLKPNHFTRVRVGHQIKFGNSTRIYIMLGPDFDREGESELTVTEIKNKALELKLERDKKIQEEIKLKEMEGLKEERKIEEQGIDWGMGEDAEDEPDLADNPYAATANEELYLDDPKKTLRGYFEREGHSLNYDCQEQGIGQFVCRVELPLDDANCGKPIVAEVIHKGKKKEAVVACALEACRILDRAGLLRQAKHESRRRKKRDWSADDYYDSDEDTLLDRTGSVETKRKKRMEKHGASEKEDSKPLTYDELVKQTMDLENKIKAEEKVLERLRGNPSKERNEQTDADSLDDFMQSLAKQGKSMASKAEISKTKMGIQKLRVELAKTQRLADIARPATLPPLVKEKDQKSHFKLGANSVLYGKRLKLKDDLMPKPKVRESVAKKQEEDFVEEVESDEDVSQTDEKCENVNTTEHTHLNSSTDDEQNKAEITKHKVNSIADIKDEAKNQRVFGPSRPPDNYVVPDNYFDQETDRDMPEITEEKSQL